MRKNARISIIVLAFILIALLVITYFFRDQIRHLTPEQYWAEQAAEIQNHKKVWLEQGITKYRIGIHLFGYLDDCSNEFVVDNNVITQVIKSDCEYSSDFGMVEDLFSMVERMIDGRLCGANGCECDGPFVIDATYDEQYGFPKSGRPATHPELRWMYGNQVFCTMLGDLGVAWDVYSFSPLP